VIGNGDIQTPESAIQHLQQYGVDAVMIGRGSVRNPFIFEQSAALWQGQSYQKPTREDYLRLLEEHRTYFEQTYRKGYALLLARKFLVWYTTGFSGCHKFRNEIFHTKDWDLAWSNARQFFQEIQDCTQQECPPDEDLE